MTDYSIRMEKMRAGDMTDDRRTASPWLRVSLIFALWWAAWWMVRLEMRTADLYRQIDALSQDVRVLWDAPHD